MRNKWIEAINEYQEFDYYTGSFFLCSLHFKKDAFEQKNNRYRLKKDVIPSIFPPHKIPRPTMKPTSPIQFVEEVEEVEHMVIEPTIYDLHQSNDPHEAVCSRFVSISNSIPLNLNWLHKVYVRYSLI